MGDHKPGSMDITTQEKTFQGFLKWAGWVVGISFAVLIFLAVFNG